MDNVIGDIRYAARVLRRNPVFTAVATLTLALGIGANTAVFNVMNAVLLRYLPVPDPERVVYLPRRGAAFGDLGDGRRQPDLQRARLRTDARRAARPLGPVARSRSE